MTKERLQQLNELGLKLREVKQTEAKLIRTTEKSLQRRNDLDVLHEEKNKLKKEVSALIKVKDKKPSLVKQKVYPPKPKSSKFKPFPEYMK